MSFSSPLFIMNFSVFNSKYVSVLGAKESPHLVVYGQMMGNASKVTLRRLFYKCCMDFYCPNSSVHSARKCRIDYILANTPHIDAPAVIIQGDKYQKSHRARPYLVNCNTTTRTITTTKLITSVTRSTMTIVTTTNCY